MNLVEKILYAGSAIVAAGTAMLGIWYLALRRRAQKEKERDALMDELVRHGEEIGLYDD